MWESEIFCLKNLENSDSDMADDMQLQKIYVNQSWLILLKAVLNSLWHRKREGKRFLNFVSQTVLKVFLNLLIIILQFYSTLVNQYLSSVKPI